jgi:hypothetical protein
MVRDAGITWEAVLRQPAPPASLPRGVVLIREEGPAPPRLARLAGEAPRERLNVVRLLQWSSARSEADSEFLLFACNRLYRSPHRGFDAGSVRALTPLWERVTYAAAA